MNALQSRGWYLVFLLMLIFSIALVDRFIIALLAQPISQDLGISDAQLGLLIGTSFAVLYTCSSVVAAHWIDNHDRTKILAFAVLLWGGMTAASGFATNFKTILVLRAGVAMGEAVLTPAAVSLIADVFPQQRRALPMSVFLSVGAVMGIGSYVVGSAALDLATIVSALVALAPWRVALIMVGVGSGALGLLLMLTVAEPQRIEDSQGAQQVSLRAFIDYFRDHAGFYLPFMLGAGLYALYGLSLITWLPTILVRAHGYLPAQAVYIYGVLGVPSGLISLFLWPRLTKWIDDRYSAMGSAIALLMASLMAIPVFTVSTGLTNTHLLLIGVVCATLLGSAWSILPPLCYQTFGPARMRARLMALNLVAINLIGFGLGPVATVGFSKLWNPPNGLGYGLAAVGAIASVGASVCYLLSLRSIRLLQRQSN